MRLLEPYRTLNHADMAKVVLAIINEAGASPNPEWWAQAVTVAYEQHIGRRKPGQRSDGGYAVTINRTCSGTMDAVLEKWSALIESLSDIDGTRIVDSPRISKTDKWRYWRCSLEDGSNIVVSMQNMRNGEKATIAIQHDKLSQPQEVERWRAYWKAVELD